MNLTHLAIWSRLKESRAAAMRCRARPRRERGDVIQHPFANRPAGSASGAKRQ